MTEHRFAVGLSFSGSQRVFISQVAECLQMVFGGKNSVLYDDFHVAEFSRSDLPTYLTGLYLNDTTLNVAFISNEYKDGGWSGLEADALAHLIVLGHKDRLMLFSFEGAILEHLPAAGYIPCENKYPPNVAHLILERYEHLIGERRQVRRDAEMADWNKAPRQVHQWANVPCTGIFVGRRRELHQVLEALRPETRTWGCVVAGPGGLGKTSLAIRAAESVDARVFDEVVFVSSKEMDLIPSGVRLRPGGRASDAIELLKEAGRQLGSGGRSRIPITERVNEFLALLRNRRALLIFDNLETLTDKDRQVVFDTLKKLPSGCKAIVTTRLASRAEASVVELAALPDDDSHALLEEMGLLNPLLALATDREKDEMVARCGGNPLILKWTLGQLGHGEVRTIGTALERLAGTDDQGDPIRFIFERMTDDLGARQRRLLAVLSIVSKPVRAAHFGELLGEASSGVLTTLGSLVDRMLVLRNLDDSLFWLPPLAGHYVSRVLKKVVVVEERAICEFVVNLFAQHGSERYSRDAVIDQHWEIVQAAVPQLCALPCRELQVLCESSRYYLLFNGHWDERRLLVLAGEQAAVAVGDYHSAFRRAYDAGMVHYRRGETDGVVSLSERVEAHAKKLPDPREGVALAFRLRSLGLRDKNELKAAIAVGKDSIELFEALGRTKDYACALNALGVTLRAAGDPVGAAKYCSLGLVVAREVGNKEYEADYVGNLADLPLDREEWDVARAQAEHALTLSTAVGRLDLTARNEFRLSRIEFGAGDFEKSAGHAERAFKLYGELGMKQAKQVMEFLSTIVARR